jgi:hypothetical protein
MFENIECEWPLFFCYLILDYCFQGNKNAVTEYTEALEEASFLSARASDFFFKSWGMLYSLVVYCCFRGTYCLHFHGQRISQVRNQRETCSNQSHFKHGTGLWSLAPQGSIGKKVARCSLFEAFRICRLRDMRILYWNVMLCWIYSYG